MLPITIVVPYNTKDATVVERLLLWMKELNTKCPNALMFAVDAKVPMETVTKFNSMAKGMFAFVESNLVHVPNDKQMWGQATKIMFERAAYQIEECYKTPWFWMEPDCVPLKPFWASDLTVAYEACPKRFMGHVVSKDQLIQGPAHLAGPAIYPPNTYSSVREVLKTNEHFDLAIASYVLPRAMHSPLIQHFWGKPGVAPTFVESLPREGVPENVFPLEYINKEAVVFHRVKDDSLIECLRKRMKKPPEPPVTLAQTVTEPVLEPIPAPADPEEIDL